VPQEKNADSQLGFFIEHFDFSSSTALLMSDDDCNGELSAAKPRKLVCNWQQQNRNY
jgi:hypothetical protein